jgi:hypothetical protein
MIMSPIVFNLVFPLTKSSYLIRPKVDQQIKP